MAISSTDEKIITVLDLSIDRSEITEGIRSTLERLKLYRENQSLMERIDCAETLLSDLENLLELQYQEAVDILKAAEKENLLKQLNKLSAAGRDLYWTNGNPDLAGVLFSMPWRD